MKTTPTIIVLAVLALAGGFAVRATREAGRNRTATDALTIQNTGLQATTAGLEQRLRTASAALAKLERKTGPTPDVPVTGGSANVASAGSKTAVEPAAPAQRVTADSLIAGDPQRLAEYLQSYRSGLDLDYGGLFKTLGLTAGQVEKFKDLWVSVQQQRMELRAAQQRLGIEPTSEAYRKMQAEIESARMAKERELLGDLYPSYREYRRTDVVRSHAAELAQFAVDSGEAVTLAQVERTTQILAANSQRNPSGQFREWVTWGTVNWPAARVQLQDVLSPTQIVELGRIVECNAIDKELLELKQRLTAEFKAKQAAATK